LTLSLCHVDDVTFPILSDTAPGFMAIDCLLPRKKHKTCQLRGMPALLAAV
jgi:hypothetical protein